MKKTILLILGLTLLTGAFAQNIDDLIWQEPQDDVSDIIKVNFEPKDARRAMLFSALLPGAGQFYAKPSSFTAYLFPVLELATIGGIVWFNKQGKDQTEAFQTFANGETVTQVFNYTVNGEQYSYTYTGTRYRRDYQKNVQTVMMNINPGALDIYDGTFFRLDDTDTQHFYEDIGKYDKYVFGWADWYHNFATDPTSGNGSFYLSQVPNNATWVFNPNNTDPQLIINNRWIKNYSIEYYMNNPGNLDPANAVAPGTNAASPWRQEYLDMRRSANQQFYYANYCTIGLALNHIAAAIDAFALTNRVNRSAITQKPFEFQYYTSLSSNNNITPSLGFTYRF